MIVREYRWKRMIFMYVFLVTGVDSGSGRGGGSGSVGGSGGGSGSGGGITWMVVVEIPH